MNNSSGVGIERYKVKCLKRALDGELLGIYRRRTEKKQNQRKSRLHFALVVHGSCVFESSCRVRQEARTVRGDRICRAGAARRAFCRQNRSLKHLQRKLGNEF